MPQSSLAAQRKKHVCVRHIIPLQQVCLRVGVYATNILYAGALPAICSHNMWHLNTKLVVQKGKWWQKQDKKRRQWKLSHGNATKFVSCTKKKTRLRQAHHPTATGMPASGCICHKHTLCRRFAGYLLSQYVASEHQIGCSKRKMVTETRQETPTMKAKPWQCHKVR